MDNIPKKGKNYTIALIIGAFVLLSFISVGSGWKYHKNAIKTQEKEAKEELLVIQKQKDSINELYQNALLLDQGLKVNEKTYYNEYIYERRKRIEAERLVDDIPYRFYPYAHLDSLGANVLYPERR